MANLILDNITLIMLLPLWIFLIIMCGRFFSVYVNKRLIYFLTLFSSFVGAITCVYALFSYNEPIEFGYPFIKINDFVISFGLQIDKLSLILASILFIISFAVQFFSVSYMQDEKKSYRFFAMLNLFNFAMSFLLFSPNLYQFYIFWELVGVASYLLIGFDYKKSVKSETSKRVFLMNRVGDTALITGLIVVSYYMFAYAGNKTFVTLSFEDFNAISTLLMAYTTTPAFYIICALFIIAAMVKSAQFPFYSWLQDAMEAHTPVSALLHSATMVVAGVYLTIKMMPFYTLMPRTLNALIIIGLLTAVICSILASVETHPKKVLAYSTSANLGLMFIAVGLVNIKAAVLLLIAHAFIKSLLFILIPKIKYMSKINFLFFAVTSLSLAGILFGGLGAKELLFKNIEYNLILSYLYYFICFMTGFYIIRLAILLYQDHEKTVAVNFTELISFLILFFGNVFLYIFIRGDYKIAEPYVAAIGGIVLALLLAKQNTLRRFSNTPKLLEKACNNYVPAFYNKISRCLNNTENKIFSNYGCIIWIAKLSVVITNWIEINIMNKAVTFVSDISKNLSRRDMILQNGNVQSYNAYAFIMITIITVLVIIGYTLIFR